MYKIYCAKIASSSFVLQNCFRIKIIGAFRSQKSLCHGGCRRSEKCGPYSAIFAGGRSRPEGSEGVRDAGQVWPGTRRTLQPPRGLGKYQNAPLNVSEASEGLKHAAERFRGLGRRQGRRPSLPGTRKTSQAAAAAPRLRKASGTPAKSCRVPGKLPCLGRGRQGRRPSLTGYQENFAGGRSRPKPPRGLWF